MASIKLPYILKDLTASFDGFGQAGNLKSFTPPSLETEMEEYRGAGMNMAVKIDMGRKTMEASADLGEQVSEMIALWGIRDIDGILITLRGHYERDDTGEDKGVKITMRGRFESLNNGGKWEPGKASENEVKIAVSYFKYEENNIPLIEVEPLGLKEVVGGVDRMKARRTNLAL